jgi:hypothetical protein
MGYIEMCGARRRGGEATASKVKRRDIHAYSLDARTTDERLAPLI